MIINFDTFVLLESVSTYINESEGGFAALKTKDAVDKEIERYEKNLEKIEKEKGDFNISSFIQYCWSKIKNGTFKLSLEKEDKDYKKQIYAAIETDSNHWTLTEFKKVVNKNFQINTEEDPKKRAELQKELKELNDSSYERYDSSNDRLAVIAFYAAGRADSAVRSAKEKDKKKIGDEQAQNFKNALNTYCSKHNIDLDIDSLCK